MSASDMQKIKKTIDNLYTEKQKLEKEKSKKSNAKGKGKASLRLEQTGVSCFHTRRIHEFHFHCHVFLFRQTFKRSTLTITTTLCKEQPPNYVAVQLVS